MAVNDRPQQIRMGLLAAVFGSLVLVTLRVLVQPEVAQQKAPVSILDFPEAIALPNWQLQAVRPWQHDSRQESGQEEPTDRPQGMQYTYRHPEGERLLEARARFLYRAGNGNTSRLLQTFTPAQPASVRIAQTYRDGVGFYGFFIFEDEASIMACINPHGETTVTGQQFSQNISLQPGRILPWLLGQQDLFDRRCLFGILAVPARQGDTTLANYPDLEAAWLDWVDRWQQAFSEGLRAD